jgi:cadmium resistance protein CadD (predicted permease)
VPPERRQKAARLRQTLCEKGLMRILENIGKGLLLFTSIICVFGSPAAFTPAVFLSFAFMPVAGIMAIYGHFYIAIMILCLSSIAVSLSPITDILLNNISNALFALVPVILGYSGLIDKATSLL